LLVDENRCGEIFVHRVDLATGAISEDFVRVSTILPNDLEKLIGVKEEFVD